MMKIKLKIKWFEIKKEEKKKIHNLKKLKLKKIIK